jgi:hypothetical protein
MGRSMIVDAPASLQAILSCIDPANDERTEIVIARDLVEANTSLRASDFREAAAYLDRLMADPALTEGDFKGLVKKLDVSALYSWQGDASSLLRALRVEIGVWLDRIETRPPSTKRHASKAKTK